MQKLNERQRAAVRHDEGPLLVLAGAGSGKTGVIAHKIARLIERGLAAPRNIAAITFTNKAAKEMRERVRGMVGKSDDKPWISTFHTLGLRILREDHAKLGYRSGFSILDAGDCAALIADLMRRDSPGTDVAINLVQQAISAWKYSLIAPGDVTDADASPASALAARCYQAYCDALMTFNAVDFDDLIMGPVRLLRADASVLRRWQEEIDYLLVDEYQDTNASQYELVRLLVDRHQRLTAVGDDDQSIYGWRGAKPDNIDQLAADFPALTVIKLEQNYRSSGIILKTANALIKHNPHKYEKRLWSDRGFGDKIRVVSAVSEHDEVERIANDILHRRLMHGTSFADFAVLLRSNHQARLFEHGFRERDIPYVLSGGRSFFDYAEIRDCVCYLRLVANPADNNAFLRIVNTPRRAIGTQSVKTLVEVSSAQATGLVEAALSAEFERAVSKTVFKRVNQFAAWVMDSHRAAEDLAADELYARILRDIDYDDWLERTGDTPDSAERRRENVAELGRWIERLAKNDQSTAADVVAALTLFDIADRQDSEQEVDGVALTTLHAAKGLEYPHVYIAGFEENLLPHRSSIDQDTIEEERRLAYVGITRAKKTLCLSMARTRKRYGQIETCEPSRFLEELPADELNWEGRDSDPEASRARGRGTLDSLKRLLNT